MSDEQFTRCPGCKTVFRVNAAQLALREGQVRCGHCRTVFNGREELISLSPPPPDEEPEVDELAQGPPTVTLRTARALEPLPPEVPVSPPVAAVDYENRFSGAKRRPHRLWTALGFVAIPLLAAVLVLQAVFHFRDGLAAHVPTTKVVLERLCAFAGCTIRPLRDVSALSIDASDLQADPAHRGLLILTATLRNRAPYAIGYPHLELTLTDAQDQVVVRRALAPADYVSGTANHAAGIAGNAEVPVKLFIDASATTQAGYRLYLFFP
ncbi:MAG: DUF3426 domain-containing protein [Betaproteobacteria bacterium]|nr:DUF3426 domain-containing protein [Betaproteobacteria bacterium]